MKKQVTVVVDGEQRTVEAGTRLSTVLDIEQPCGGRGTCGKCKVTVDGETVLACQYTVTADIRVQTANPSQVVSETGTVSDGRMTDHRCFVLDIGTTTLALALVSLDEKKVVKVLTADNPQRRFGADIITRIDHCRQYGVGPLHDTLTAAINRLIERMGVTADTLYVAANVTMLHTLFSTDCSSIGVAPYTPAFLKSRTEPADEVGISGVNTVISLPSVASFVGADIVAGLHLVGAPAEGRYDLLVDLGTNAEVVLFSADGGVATAAAAGPCFEGANIRCGQSATAGAVCAFRLQDGVPSYETVGGKPATGICGTGLIDLIAELLASGIIDESGYMESDYVLCDGVYLSCDDVRQYQLAKSAVYSAIVSLMKTENIGFDRIDRLYISGGFSAKVCVDSAVRTGLLPAELADRVAVLNNSSLQGTIRYACEGGDLQRITDTVRYVDLAASPYFSDLFMANMMFE